MEEDLAVNAKETEAIRTALARHGYGFQYAVVKHIRSLRALAWRIEACEVPVQVRGADLAVDIVLRAPTALMAIECKRANPALSLWCFARSRVVPEGKFSADGVWLEALARPDRDTAFHVVRNRPESSDKQYDIGIEVKTDQKGDPSSPGRGALNDAIGQSLRAASGLINSLKGRPALFGSSDRLRIVPAIFTTAKLVSCDTDLAESSLVSGDLPEAISLQAREWVWLRHNASFSLRHEAEASTSEPPQDFSDVIENDHVRSVAIVSQSGISTFLQQVKFHLDYY